jgi:hypothetical protein
VYCGGARPRLPTPPRWSGGLCRISARPAGRGNSAKVNDGPDQAPVSASVTSRTRGASVQERRVLRRGTAAPLRAECVDTASGRTGPPGPPPRGSAPSPRPWRRRARRPPPRRARLEPGARRCRNAVYCGGARPRRCVRSVSTGGIILRVMLRRAPYNRSCTDAPRVRDVTLALTGNRRRRTRRTGRHGVRPCSVARHIISLDPDRH